MQIVATTIQGVKLGKETAVISERKRSLALCLLKYCNNILDVKDTIITLNFVTVKGRNFFIDFT